MIHRGPAAFFERRDCPLAAMAPASSLYSGMPLAGQLLHDEGLRVAVGCDFHVMARRGRHALPFASPASQVGARQECGRLGQVQKLAGLLV